MPHLPPQTAPAEAGGLASRIRTRISIRGLVQGVGFRPFVYRLARELGLAGWVRNDPDGVWIEAEGTTGALDAFLTGLRRDHPAVARIDTFETTSISPSDEADFVIKASEGGSPTTLVLPDLATCPLCVADLFAPGNRRFRYPFTNCTNCGPRYTIVESLPYDRARTSMKGFSMCERCATEYSDPADRRFHAQPNACPDCGPSLRLLDATGSLISERDDALLGAAEIVRLGGIVALKGLGGFQLICDARNEETVARLRSAKAREEKPFALMVPSLPAAELLCRISNREARVLASPRAPIVLVRRHERRSSLADSVAPSNPWLGLMLPYTPLHHLLLSELGFAVVATSGNRKDEPICIDESEALTRLAGIADFFLVHDRPIVRHMDDSVVVVADGEELVYRRARGYAPLPVADAEGTAALLAVGGHQKNTTAATIAGRIFVSQHIGDLETAEALEAHREATASLAGLYGGKPEIVVRDLHPGYASSAEAERLGLPQIAVQHHHAHVVSCMAEHGLDGDVLGVAWDGSGWGPDGTVWGGEFLLASRDRWQRFAHLRAFPLPGGEKAVREPRRAALGLLWELLGDEALAVPAIFAAFDPEERKVLGSLLAKGTSPRTSSAGRLFDAVSFLAGGRPRCSFEGQAAMELEFAVPVESAAPPPWTFAIGGGTPRVIDWGPAIRELLDEVEAGAPRPLLASRFHSTLAVMISAVAAKAGLPRVVLSGGCFQNRILSRRATESLRRAGLTVYTHRAVPPNDGGLAVGQIAIAARMLAARRSL